MTPPLRPSVRTSLTAAMLEAAVVGGMFACLEAWIVPLLQGRLGVAAATIGVLAMLPQLASIAIGPVSGKLIRWLGGPRAVAIHHCWIQVAGFAVLQIPLYLSIDGQPPVWTAGIAVAIVALMNGVGAVLGGPAWTAYFGGLVPHRIMGRYTSRRNRIFHISRLSFAGIFMVVMAAFPITDSVLGMHVVLTLALLSRLASTFLQLRQMELPQRPVLPSSPSLALEVPTTSFVGFLRTLTGTTFGQFTLVWSLFHVGLMVAGPYYATYLVATHTEGGLDLGGQAVLYTALVYANTLTRLIFLPYAGGLVDRHGSTPIFRQAVLMMTFIPAGWALAALLESPWPILVTEILSGYAWALADASVGPHLFRCHQDPHQRAHLIAWHSTIFQSCCLIGTGIGMLVLMLPMGSVNHYLVLFLASLVLRVPALVLARRFLRTTGGPVERQQALWRLVPGIESSMAFGRALMVRFRRDDDEE